MLFKPKHKIPLDPLAKELTDDECTAIFEIEITGSFEITYWIGAESPFSAVGHVPDHEVYGLDTSLEIRMITVEEANELTVDNDDGHPPRRMSAYFNENPGDGEMIVCSEW